jgi:hypothetical protein
MTKKDYFPLINSGHTMRLAGQMDSSRLYTHLAKIKLSDIGLFPRFEWHTYDIDNSYGEYQVLVIGDDPVDAIIDYNVIISRN